ncbi:PAS domain-containing hybrid sensor histidine kinase/response regulator [Anaerotardibacter muris]|uniref:PAS domain-containing hybrid sensor histidine kinase/response regulator n=1 Tax=Anaerotardibacter muris TaxID=2941505 RepID=UPI0020421047|nr:PAS domain-containing hybrid sensor histidine kinase/response regulator [Anaerotardibacter muris]
MDTTTPQIPSDLVINEQTLPVIEHLGDAMPGGFFIYHADGNEELLYANKAMFSIFGCEDLEQFKELTGFTFPGLVHPEDRARTEAAIAEQIAANKNNLDYVEYRIIRADGEIRWITDYGHFVHTETYGDIFYVFISDATEMRLKRLENKKRDAVIYGLASEYDDIFLLDLEHYAARPYMINGAPTEYMHDIIWTRDKIDKMFLDYAQRSVVEDDRAIFLDAVDLDRIEQNTEHDGHFMLNYRILDDQGQQQWIRISVADVDSGSEFPQVVFGFKNVTEHMTRVEEEAEAHLRTKQELNKALQATQAKNAFLFNMSHDVRTPLNAIVGFATLTRKYLNDPVRVSECLDAIDSASDQLIALVNDVLDMSQLESGSMDVRPMACSMPDKIDHVTSTLMNVAAEHKVTLQVSVDDPGVKVMADTAKLRRILYKVIDNAIKFNRPGGKVSVDARGVLEGDKVNYTYTITDTGIGMSPELQERIFDNFERGANTTQTREAGSGLGLPIMKALVDMMDGTIDVESEQGVGSTFTIKLTFDVAAPEAASVAFATDEESAAQLARIRGKRVLVVEDNELNALITETILTDAGMVVDIVEDGTEAVNTMRHERPGFYDLILMDIQMPIMNGYDATRAIRALDREDIADLPIIALSANALDEDKRLSLESGMNAHLAKPINVTDLLFTLEQYL